MPFLCKNRIYKQTMFTFPSEARNVILFVCIRFEHKKALVISEYTSIGQLMCFNVYEQVILYVQVHDATSLYLIKKILPILKSEVRKKSDFRFMKVNKQIGPSTVKTQNSSILVTAMAVMLHFIGNRMLCCKLLSSNIIFTVIMFDFSFRW